MSNPSPSGRTAKTIATSERRASSAASAKLKQMSDEADAHNDKVTRFEDEQRAKRAQLSAEDAIKFSAEIQAEQSMLDRLNAQRDAAQVEYTTASHAYQNHLAKLIPVIALLILHLVGSMLFWPRPQERALSKVGDSRPVRVKVENTRPQTKGRK